MKSYHSEVLGFTYSPGMKDRPRRGRKTEAVAGKEDDDERTCLSDVEKQEQGGSLALVDGPVINKMLKCPQSANNSTKPKQNRSEYEVRKDLPDVERALEDCVEKAKKDGVNKEELDRSVGEEPLQLNKKPSDSSCKRKNYFKTSDMLNQQCKPHRKRRSERNETRIIACEPCANKESRRWCLKRHEWKWHGKVAAQVGKNKCSELLANPTKSKIEINSSELLANPTESKIQINSSKEEFDKFKEKADNEKENSAEVETKKRKFDKKRKRNKSASLSKIAETKKRKSDREWKEKKESALKKRVAEEMLDVSAKKTYHNLYQR